MTRPTDPFDFSHVDWDGTAHPPVDDPAPTPPTSSRDHARPADRGVRSTGGARLAPGGRDQLGVVAIVCAGLASALIGVGANRALGTVDITSLDPLGTAWDWGVVATVGGLLVAVAVVLSVVALARRRTTTAWVALLTALLLPPAATLLGVETGLRSLSANIAADVRGASSAGLESLDAALESSGLPAGPLRAWLTDELGNG